MLHLWLVFNYQKQKFLKAISIIISTLFWVSEDQFIYGFVMPQRTRVLVICQMKYRLDTLFCLKINDDNKTLTSPSKSFKLKVSCAVKLPLWGGTIAQCFRPGFESQADQLCWDCVLLSFLVKICATFVFALWKDTKYNQKEAGIGSNKWYWVFSGYLSLSF